MVRFGMPRRTRTALAGMALAIFGLAGLVTVSAAQAGFPGATGPIYFDSNRDVGAADIYRITPGGTAGRVTTSTGSSDPAVSPDGSKIAFISADPGEPYQVFVVNANGTGRRQVTTSSPAKQQPAWSPDGTRITYVANTFDVDAQTDPEIWAVGLNGASPTQLTSNTLPDTYPAWSPDGSRIAFVRQADVWVMNAGGGGEVNLTPNIGSPCTPDECYQGPDSDPAWAPDGSKIAFVHGLTRVGGGLPNIWTMDPAGAQKTNITSSDDVGFTTPAFSPTGDRLAVTGATGTNRDIWVMNAGGGARSRLETTAAFDTNPDWGSPPPAQRTPSCQGHTATIIAAAPGQVTIGTPRRDIIVGSPRRDTIRSRGGNDLICTLGGRDVVFGGSGADAILGQGDDDTLFGGRGADVLFGGPGNDKLDGGPGRDRLLGGPGRDRLVGGPSRDFLRGGPGRDTEIQ